MHKRISFRFIAILMSIILQLPVFAQHADKFKQEWASKLEFKGVILEEKNYHIWCTSPIWGNDGKVHLFVSRIPVLPEDKNPKKGFEYWYSSSEIAQYSADHPEGPFQFRKVLLKPGDAPAGAWNCGTQHNPAIL